VPRPVWVSGEALIDLLSGETPDTLRAIAGGGPANTALALAKLEIPVQFVGGLSHDRFGQQISKQFLENGVGLELAIWSDLPTCLAIVSLDEHGGATYHFHIQGTATFDFDSSLLPDPALAPPSVLHVGTLATLVEPSATHLLEWAKRVAKHAPVVFDPNIRSSVLSDRDAYRTSVQRWVEIANVVKVSEDDLRFLYPDFESIASARSWLGASRPLVVITRGENGLIGVTANEIIEVPGVRVDVVDSVGAGDTVGAVIVEALIAYGVNDLRGESLRSTLVRAAKAAAITCSRAGCQPPTAAELRN
jgi:fructokinase